ncbi:hypothetical protein BJ875DRAFT_375690 [Amylocarpus encephaloides]|uniref:Survival Motor Neuron Gemin2-binding domain-containing protein n=1 Tax=Amylocarpus encephaloides TaxID=45428 RepID=A0A9P7YJP7_9HELO|nr:hypothetical protein BJ875DRAFT_375690 [Amylocarpus encephaloides]
MSSNAEASHEEVWDDSVLVDSWNDAVEEYRQYHSIKSRGEDTDVILKAHEIQSKALFVKTLSWIEPKSLPSFSGEKMDSGDGGLAEQPSIDQPPQNDMPDEIIGPDKVASLAEEEMSVLNQTTGSGSSKGPAVPALPQHLIGQAHDGKLKNLLMSWYYAGYYTGLYEGQQGIVEKDAKH